MEKKVFIVLALAAILACPAMAAPTTVTFIGTDGLGVWHSGLGGEFTVDPGDWGWDPMPLYASVVKDQGGTVGTFQTFCLEKSEFISPYGTYNVVFNSAAVLGGQAVSDPISIGTAYLYHEFQKGTLDYYDYADTVPGESRKASAALLQDAIWYLEGEVPNVNNIYTQLVAGLYTDPMADNNGAIPVAVMNLYDSAGNRCQDALVCVPAPGAIMLASMGMGLVSWLRRRQAL